MWTGCDWSLSEFKYLECILDKSGTDESECSRKGASGRRVAGAIRSLVNAWGLWFECAKVYHESLLVLVLTYGSYTIIGKEKERARIRAVHIDNLRGLLGIRRMDKVPNAWIRKLCRMMKGMDKRIDEGVLRCGENRELLD